MTEHKITPEYIPGTCNIGPQEISRRYRIGFFGLFVTAMLIVIIETMDLPRPWRLVIAAPVTFSLTGFVQAMQRFCFAYGLSGVFSIQGLRQLSKVRDNAFLKQDRKTAIRLVAIVIIGTILITILYYLLPGA